MFMVHNISISLWKSTSTVACEIENDYSFFLFGFVRRPSVRERSPLFIYLDHPRWPPLRHRRPAGLPALLDALTRAGCRRRAARLADARIHAVHHRLVGRKNHLCQAGAAQTSAWCARPARGALSTSSPSALCSSLVFHCGCEYRALFRFFFSHRQEVLTRGIYHFH